MNVGSVQYGSNATSYSSMYSSSTQSSDFQSIMEKRMSQLEKAVDSGQIDTAQLQEDLQSQFGDVVNEAFGEDGSIDFEKLKEILESQAGSMGEGTPEMQGPPPGGPPPGPPPSEGSSGVQMDPEKLQAKLIDIFGEEAEGIVNEDGEVDIEKLQELTDQRMAASANSTKSAYGYQTSSSSSSSLMHAAFVNLTA